MNVAVSLIYIKHVFFCKNGGFVPLPCNHTRNITLILLKEVCEDVLVEPKLQQLTGEYLQHSIGAGNEVRLNISARGFWQAGHLDVRVFILKRQTIYKYRTRQSL